MINKYKHRFDFFNHLMDSTTNLPILKFFNNFWNLHQKFLSKYFAGLLYHTGKMEVNFARVLKTEAALQRCP